MKSTFPHFSNIAMIAQGLVILTCSAAVLLGQSIGGSLMNGDNDIPQLVHVLDGAYRNSLLHDSSNQDLESSDLLLENASIDLSARVLDSMKSGACASGADAGSDSACALDDTSLALGDWTEMISYAAYRLENIARRTSNPSPSQAIVGARLGAMEHLYRMVFAVAKIHFDRTQSLTYLDAAQEQMKLARAQMEGERNLCHCDPSGLSSRLTAMSELDVRMNSMRDSLSH